MIQLCIKIMVSSVSQSTFCKLELAWYFCATSLFAVLSSASSHLSTNFSIVPNKV